MKTCSKCNGTGPFSRLASEKDGLQRVCKKCVNAYMRQRYITHHEKLKAQSDAYTASHRAEARARASKWYAENKARAQAQRKKYRDENLEAATRRDAAYYRANAERLKALASEWRIAHPRHRATHQRTRRARKSGANGKHTAADIQTLFNLQRGKCAICEEALKIRYHVDHIKALAKGGDNTRHNLQLLCATCNISKHTKDNLTVMRARGFLL